jgi:hypothetical protein
VNTQQLVGIRSSLFELLRRSLPTPQASVTTGRVTEARRPEALRAPLPGGDFAP